MIQKEDSRNKFLSQKSPRACVLPSAGVETKDCPVWASHSLLLWNGCRNPSSLTGVGQLCVARRCLQSVGTRRAKQACGDGLPLRAVFLSPETSLLWHLCSCSSEMQPKHMECPVLSLREAAHLAQNGSGPAPAQRSQCRWRGRWYQWSPPAPGHLPLLSPGLSRACWC